MSRSPSSLADDVIDANPPALAQMLNVFDEVNGPVPLVERVPASDISSYGVIDAEPIRPGVYRVKDLVEKPHANQAPSDLAIIGRTSSRPTSSARSRRPPRIASERSADQRPEAPVEIPPDVRVRGARRPARYRQQTRVLEGRPLLRPPAPRSGRPLREYLKTVTPQ
jgi:hypothetical protein